VGFKTKVLDYISHTEYKMAKLVECVPNFSEGRRPEVIEAICKAITEE